MDTKNWIHPKQDCCCPLCISKSIQNDVTPVNMTTSFAMNSFMSPEAKVKSVKESAKYERFASSAPKRTTRDEVTCDNAYTHDTDCSCAPHNNYVLSKKNYVTMTSTQRTVSVGTGKHCTADRPTYRKNIDVAKPYMTLKMKSNFHMANLPFQRKRKRHRTAFTPTQLLGLENAFERGHYLVGDERKQLAEFLRLSETQIKVWFQNRRTKFKRQRQTEFTDEYYEDIPLSENLVECLEALSHNHNT